MDHKELLISTARVIDERGREYGDMRETHDRIARIATDVLGKEISAYDVAIVHHATKLARIRKNPQHLDSYRDGNAYLAFGAELAGASENPPPVQATLPLPKLSDEYSPRGAGLAAISNVLSEAMAEAGADINNASEVMRFQPPRPPKR